MSILKPADVDLHFCSKKGLDYKKNTYSVKYGNNDEIRKMMIWEILW